MSGYLFFKGTGEKCIDAIANKLTEAGNAYHHTEMWDDDDDGESYIDQIDAKLADAASEIAKLREQLAKAREQYEELLYGVSRKLPDETRHETALRYILQAEKQDNTPCKATEADN